MYKLYRLGYIVCIIIQLVLRGFELTSIGDPETWRCGGGHGHLRARPCGVLEGQGGGAAEELSAAAAEAGLPARGRLSVEVDRYISYIILRMIM